MVRIVYILALVAYSTLTLQAGNISAVWANEGGDKVTREELRASKAPDSVSNASWDGNKISLFGAKNEVVSFNVVIEASLEAAKGVSVTFSRLASEAGAVIESKPVGPDRVFEWRDRPIELFYVRYQQIKGLSYFGYGKYDERHIPEKLRRPWTGDGVGKGTWLDRPNHDAFYPDIAVPMELNPSFDIAAGNNQSVWVDVYIPKDAQDGLYQGTVTISEKDSEPLLIPVQLQVRRFSLPDAPSLKTMMYYSHAFVNNRYMGQPYIEAGFKDADKIKKIHDRHYLMAHRHKISLIGDHHGWLGGDCLSEDRPCDATIPRLKGSFYTAQNGYAGPGTGVPNDIYSIWTYGQFPWKAQDRAAMWKHTDAWASWFTKNAPEVEAFLYLIDESFDYPQIENWAKWIAENPGPGGKLHSMATLNVIKAVSDTPSLTIPTHVAEIAIKDLTQAAVDATRKDPKKRFYAYNGSRPASGSDEIEDDGVALRVRAWAQYKKRIDRWFQWESTSWGDGGKQNVLASPVSFGHHVETDPTVGEAGYSNGHGLFFYPGTDRLFPKQSFDLDGPIASLRLKHWRRGQQDGDYLTLAAAIDPAAVDAIVQRMVPLVLWECDVADPKSPTWQRMDMPWSNNPDLWEQARGQLAAIIEGLPPAGPEAAKKKPPVRVKK